MSLKTERLSLIPGQLMLTMLRLYQYCLAPNIQSRVNYRCFIVCMWTVAYVKVLCHGSLLPFSKERTNFA